MRKVKRAEVIARSRVILVNLAEELDMYFAGTKYDYLLL